MTSFVMTTRLIADPRVRRTLDRLSHLDTTKLLDSLGQLVEGQVQRRIVRTKESPDGQPWAPLSDSYAQWKRGVKPRVGILQFDGHLRDSVQHVVHHDAVEIGTNLKKAPTHQYGDTRTAFGKYEVTIPARPFLGLSDQNRDGVEATTVDWLRRVIGR